MARIDKIKEQIGYLKVLFSILIAILVSIVGWFASHYDNMTIYDARAQLSILLVFILAIGIVYINKKIIYYINKLEDI